MPVIIVAVPILNTLKEWMGTNCPLRFLSVRYKKLVFYEVNKRGSYALVKAWCKWHDCSHPDEKFLFNEGANLSNTPNSEYLSQVLATSSRKTQLERRPWLWPIYLDTRINEFQVGSPSPKISNLPGWNLFVTTQNLKFFHEIYEILYNVIIQQFVFNEIIFLLLNQIGFIEKTNSSTDPAF